MQKKGKGGRQKKKGEEKKKRGKKPNLWRVLQVRCWTLLTFSAVVCVFACGGEKTLNPFFNSPTREEKRVASEL